MNDKSPRAGAPEITGEEIQTRVAAAARRTRLMSPAYRLHFAARVMQDALAEASAGYFLRRAQQLRLCLSRPDDYPGDKYATPEETAMRDQERADRDARLAADIERCLTHAALLAEGQAEISPEVVDALREVA